MSLTGLYIFLGIVAAIILILSLKAKVILEFNDTLYLSVKVLCFNIRIAPSKEKKPVNVKDYTFKKHQRRLAKNYEKYQKKQEKKEAKKAKKAEKKLQKKSQKAKSTAKQPKRSILDWVNIAGAVIGALFGRFAKRLRVKVARLNIKVATGDAASTAILYGAVIQSVAYIIEILRKITNVDGIKNSSISVEPDYLSEEMSFDLKFVFSLRVWHIFDILFGTLGKAIKKLIETNPQKSADLNTNTEINKINI